jgi:RNA polymerase sigma factor (sigma-70 family)
MPVETMQQSATMHPETAADFAVLLDEHRRLVFKVATTYARGGADIEDLAQEIAAQLWRAFPKYDPTRRFSTWMYRIALNVAISWVRVEAPRRRNSIPYDAELHESAATDANEPDDDERRLILRGFVDAQDPLNRAVLLLYLEEHSYAEMSDILGLSETNLTTKINRLKERLRLYAEKHHGTR